MLKSIRLFGKVASVTVVGCVDVIFKDGVNVMSENFKGCLCYGDRYWKYYTLGLNVSVLSNLY